MQGRGTNRQVGIHASGMGPVGQGWVSSGQFGSSCVKSGQLGSARAKLGQVGSDVDGCGAADRRPGTICFAAVEARSAVNSAAFQSYVDFEYTYARHVEAQGHVCAWMTREQTSRTACSIPMGIARQCMHACMHATQSSWGRPSRRPSHRPRRPGWRSTTCSASRSTSPSGPA